MADKELARTSDEFSSCTSTVDFYKIGLTEDLIPPQSDVNGHNLVLVDTPGFDDTNLSDTMILRRIALALALLLVHGHILQLTHVTMLISDP